MQPLTASEIEPDCGALKALRQLGGVSWNVEADALADKIDASKDANVVEPDRASIAMSAMALVDKFGGDIGKLAGSMALKVSGQTDYSKIDPSQ